MGLDQYLEREHYIGGEYEHRKVTGCCNFTINTGTEREHKIEIPINKVSTVSERIAYWRKANAIHAWITKDRKDDTEREISGKELFKLRDDCKKVIEFLENQEMIEKEIEDQYLEGKTITIKTWQDTSLAEKLLPTQSGFFFGSTVYDKWYLHDLKDTVRIIEENIEPNEWYKYIASY